MNHNTYAVILSLVFTGAAGCGTGDSEGYLTDHNICRANEELLASDAAVYTPTGYERLYGTLGSDPRAAQSFTTTVKRELWGLQLYLQAAARPNGGVKVELASPDQDGGPGGSSVAQGTITPENISSLGGWVSIQLNSLVTLDTSTDYWIRLTPNYSHAESNRVGWAYVAGSGYATYSLETKTWSRQNDRQTLYRFIECQ